MKLGQQLDIVRNNALRKYFACFQGLIYHPTAINQK